MASYNQINIDQIRNFFSLDGRLEPLNVAPTATGGAGINNLDQYPPPKPAIPLKKNHGTEYVQFYKQKALEKQNLRKQTFDLPGGSMVSIQDIEDVEDISTAVGDLPAVNDLNEETTKQIYATYFKDLPRTYDSGLTITTYRDEILRLLEINTVVIIQGPTGCGKTTQVPQYILDHCAAKNTYCNIVVTQPRKIAAISIARRVCQERKWQLGTVVGYQVALDPKVSADTRLSYVTTGVFLEKLVAAKRMDMYTHIIIDEVHERDQDIDFALLLVKKFLSTNCDKVKVILMSATFDSSMFARYFNENSKGITPIIDISGKSKEVTEHYLHELKTLTKRIPEFDFARPMIDPCLFDAVVNLMYVFDRIEKAEQNIGEEQDYAPARGAVLIFLPGYEEIAALTNKLSTARFNKNFWILPLHSSITIEEQTKVFRDPPPDHRKVILSTNIAESSITVPDIKYVIDFCLTKSLVTDPFTNYTCLQLEWASKANCIQRKGRAGRVDIGKVYRMVPKSFYDDFPDYGIPEIKRCPLTSTILHVKKLDPGEPKEMLAFALEPPNQRDIETAVLQLKEAFALIPNANGIYDGDLTFIGRVMANLPLDIKLSKLIVFGYAFNCLDECITIAASLSLQSFFARPFDKALEAYKEQLLWSKNTASDCLAYLYAYRTWKRLADQGQFLRPGGVSEATWCRNSFVQLKRIREADLLIRDIKSRLERMNIVIRKAGKSLSHEEEVLILKILIAGAFFPHYYLQEPLDETEIMREINDNDPYSTVVVSNLPANQGLLYACAVRDMMSVCSKHLNIEFEERKAYIRFERNHEVSSNTVLLPVYLAVKMRKCQKGPSRRAGFELSVFSPEEAERKMEQIKKLMNAPSENSLHSHRYTVQLHKAPALKRVQLPSLDHEFVPIFVSHFNNCGHFWARYLSGEVGNSLKFLETTVNYNQGKNLKPLSKKAEVNMLCLAPYADSRNGPTLYYRAQVQDVQNNLVKVFFVDYGNMEKVDEKDLREIDENVPDLINTPALAFECFLSEVRPSSFMDPSGNWCHDANMWFKGQINGARLQARIYSIVQNTVRVELMKGNEDGTIMNINKELIRMKYGEPAEESFVSKQSHEARVEYVTYVNQPPIFDNAHNTLQFSLEDATKFSDLKTTNRKITLHGPSNPLEAKYVGLTSTDTCRCIQVEASSLNSISFNSEPQDPNTTMLVAAHVGVGAETGSLMLRNTTLMPKILGLPSLICLIFAPFAEIRTDKDRKTYTGALCGLGYDSSTGEALYPEHDIEIPFDTEFPLEDICQVNGVRMAFNMLLGTDGDLADYSSRSRAYMHEKLKGNLFQLLKQSRKPKTPQMFRCEGQWKMIPPEFQLNAEPEDSHAADYIAILPLHRPSSLAENFEGMKAHLDELYQIVDKSTTNAYRINRCQLCSKDCVTTRDLLLHLDSQLHQEKERQFKQKAGY